MVHGELDRAHIQILAPQIPGEVLRRDQVRREAPEGLLIDDVELRRLVDVRALVARAELGQCHVTKGSVHGRILLPCDIDGLRECDGGREDTGVGYLYARQYLFFRGALVHYSRILVSQARS